MTVSVALVPAGVCVSRLGVDREMVPTSSFLLKKSSREPCPSSAFSKISQESFPCTPDIFQIAASKLYIGRLFVMLSLEGQGFSLLSPSGSPTVKLWDF